jgi:hypothetical protein
MLHALHDQGLLKEPLVNLKGAHIVANSLATATINALLRTYSIFPSQSATCETTAAQT